MIFDKRPFFPTQEKYQSKYSIFRGIQFNLIEQSIFANLLLQCSGLN